MTTFRDNYALMIDVSKYNPKINWPVIKSAGVAAVAIRSSCGCDVDPMLEDHCQKAYDSDLPVILYHAMDPGYYVNTLQSLDKLAEIDKWLPPIKDQQWQAFVKAAQYKKFYAVALDFEIYLDWQKKTITDSWLVEIARQWLIRLRKFYPLDRQIFYSAAWFVEGYAPSIEKTAILKPMADLWTAYYPYSTLIVNLPDWSLLKADYPPESMTINGRVTQNPPYIGWDNWTFWQWSGDKFKLPGITDASGNLISVDLNFFNGTKDQLYKYLGFAPASVVTPAPPVVVTPPAPSKPDPDTNPDTAELELELTALTSRVSLLEAKLAGIKAAL